jgi:maltooligosyltrehalose trehalohydrolase
MSIWTPTLGATVHASATAFRVWAPDAEKIELVLENGPRHRMYKDADGYFSLIVPDVGAGELYRYAVGEQGPFPDPASRFQPLGVHGPSAVVDPAAYAWTDSQWEGVAIEDLSVYELHVGTFTGQGAFRAAMERLPVLAGLGVTAVELMPVADFAGSRNWGYDGVSLFAPARCYGTPDDLRALVNEAHRVGLAVLFDVVYNHFGPDGAYQGVFSRHYFSRVHRSPWGDGINFDGPQSGPVRDFFIENALRWIHEYHADGLRIDATHAIVDDSPRHILASISGAVRASLAGSARRVHLFAEDHSNLAGMVQPESHGGWGLDGLWSDDFHHQMRRALAGDSDGYFQDFDGSAASIAETARKGWFYTGQHSPYFGRDRGTDPSGVDYPRFVFFLQNHDQIGNRAFGDRLHHKIGLAEYRAAAVLWLLLPETPLFFMGQEWAASTPFLYFTDHNPELGKLVTEGRRREFSRFRAFSDPHGRESIPDPQDQRTFESSRLVWAERDREPHAGILRLHQELLKMRRAEPALRTIMRSPKLEIEAIGDSIALRRASGPDALLVLARLTGGGQLDASGSALARLADGAQWQVALHTEDPRFEQSPQPPAIDAGIPSVTFARPGAVVLRAGKERS